MMHEWRRTVLYSFFTVSSFILFGLSGKRLYHTMQPSLHNGKTFYEPIVAELLLSSLLGMIWACYALRVIHRRDGLGNVYAAVFVVLTPLMLFVLHLIGAAIATSVWAFCIDFHGCRALAALVTSAWISWTTLTSTLVFEAFNIANSLGCSECRRGPCC
ncbi:hypothetical protein R3P38DRAFT_2967101 [Favolaschia claudopus]|uniref:Transmembrane protein n=1 Tax=Favolaschia claudopus TaxID=2862362 RepID=A0AAW0B576_9AGAR